MTLKWAVLKAFEYSIDNNVKEYDDILIFSEKHKLQFSVFSKEYNREQLKEYYDDVSDVSFGVFVTFKKIVYQVDC